MARLCAVGRGGKGLLHKQVLQGAVEGFLVALDRQQIVAPLFVEDLLGRFHLRVQSIGQHGLAHQILLAQQLAPGGDFVALGLGHDTAQEPSGGVDRVDDLHPAVADLLAVDDHDPILSRSQELILPPQQHPLDGLIIDPVQEPAEGGRLGTTDLSGSDLASESQGAQLPLTQGVSVLGQILGTQDHALGHGHDRQAGQPGHRIAQGLGPTKFGNPGSN
jgi:hypothetical protein